MEEKNGEHPYGDLGQLIFLGLFLMVWVADSFFLHLSTFPAAFIPLALRLVVLGGALVTAAYLVKSGHVVVSHGERPTSVVSTGAFRYVRHPLYLGCILFYLGLTVSTVSLVALALLVIICIFYNFLADYEEKLLERKFGEEYRQYKNKTGKWLPGLG
ncbi:MAG: methyltransferase family protein [Thermodesulfobacteriota bacterium]